ncbi:MAG: ribose-phosphate pyrophosphokinase [Armatimonadia bacterium]
MTGSGTNPLRIISGSSNRPLADEVCEQLDVALTPVELSRFSNENLAVQVLDSVRECDVFVIQSLYPAPSESLIELMLLLDACRSASAARVTAVIPHYSYARSDKKDKPRISIAARLMADVLTTAGANRFLTMNLHSEQVRGFFSVPTDHLLAMPVICEYLRQGDLSNATALFDLGQDKRAGNYAEALGIPLAVVDKRRISDTEVEIRALIGEVEGKDVIFFDDEISRGTSLIATLNAIKQMGARSVRAACTHGLFAGNAMAEIDLSVLTEVISTNTVNVPPEKRIPKLTVLSVAPLFAAAIANTHDGRSISTLFT